MKTIIVLIVLLLVTTGAVAGQSFGGASIDRQGNVYMLDLSGSVKLVAGAEKRTIIPGGSDLLMDVSVIRHNLVLAVRDGRSPNGRVESYSLEGEKLRAVSLADRFWPQRVEAFGDRIAVLGTSPEEGTFIEFLDGNHNVIPGARLYTAVECADLDLVDMAVGQDGIYVAPLQYCRTGYLVRKYDSEGNILAELAGSLKDTPTATVTDDAGREGTTFTLAIKDVFVTARYVGVVLDELDEKGALVDLWTHGGKFVERVVIPGVRSGSARALPSSGDELTVVGSDDESLVRINLTSLVGAK